MSRIANVCIASVANSKCLYSKCRAAVGIAFHTSRLKMEFNDARMYSGDEQFNPKHWTFIDGF